eukprot:1736316-Pleurochrysis_carterae.AAC.2
MKLQKKRLSRESHSAEGKGRRNYEQNRRFDEGRRAPLVRDVRVSRACTSQPWLKPSSACVNLIDACCVSGKFAKHGSAVGSCSST